MTATDARRDEHGADEHGADDAPFEARGPSLRLTGQPMRELGRAFRTRSLVAAGLGSTVTATRVAQALLIGRILGHVLHGRGPVAPGLVAIAAVTVLRAPLIWLRERQAATIAVAVRADLRSRLFAHVAALGPGYLVRHRTGELEHTLVDSVERLGDYYGEFVPLALASIVGVVAILAWVAVLDPLTALVMAGCALLVPLAPILTARAFGSAGRQFSEGLARMAAEYLDAIQGLMTLKAFNAGERWGRRLSDTCEEISAEATALAGLTNMHIGFVSLGMAGGTVLGVAWATIRTTHHAVSGAALIAILLLARECFRPLGDLQAAFPAAYEAVAGANGIFDLLDAVPDTAGPATPHGLTAERSPAAPSVRFDAVTFSYSDDRPPALDGVSFDVAGGETVAIVGPSGAGKTTLVSLLLRFFDPQSGHIAVAGQDVRSLALDELRSLVAVTFQDTYLLHRSVRANLLLARPEASDAEIEAVARAANAAEFIESLPGRYDTLVGERGARLSGGERLRLAIARALLADPAILVLDEPTSSVDAASEALIGEAVERLTAGRTTIIVAHRLSTVQRADRIVVLDSGRVVEIGRPDELRRGSGAFARLVRAQVLAP